MEHTSKSSMLSHRIYLHICLIDRLCYVCLLFIEIYANIIVLIIQLKSFKNICVQYSNIHSKCKLQPVKSRKIFLIFYISISNDTILSILRKWVASLSNLLENSNNFNFNFIVIDYIT